MGRAFRFVTWWYKRLLRLYPREHQVKFGAEQAGVFRQAALDAERRGVHALAGLLLREMANLPGILLRGYLPAVRLAFKQKGESWEMAAVLIPFCMPLLTNLSVDWYAWLIFAWLAVAGALLLLALYNGLPRWSIPYAGVLHSVLFLVLLNIKILGSNHSLVGGLYRWWSPTGLWERLTYQIVLDGILAMLQVVLAGSIVAIFWLAAHLVKIPRRWRFERDWTMFSFLFYSGNILGLLITLDEYNFRGSTMAVAVLFLALGAWGYLRADYPAMRVLALLAGTGLACCTVAVGKWIILPWQNWPWFSAAHPLDVERRYETLSALLSLPWMAILILLPAFFRPPRFPKVNSTEPDQLRQAGIDF